MSKLDGWVFLASSDGGGWVKRGLLGCGSSGLRYWSWQPWCRHGSHQGAGMVPDKISDYTSNMKDELNGLKTLIMRETQSAYYIHCFAHQLQLTLIFVSKKKSKDYGWFFDTLGDLLNVVGASCKRKDLLKGKQVEKVTKAFENGEIVMGKGLNQELGLGRPCDTRWGSHYKMILNMIDLYPAIREVLDLIGNDVRNDDDARNRIM
ncbi:hypothetical protein V6N13_028611 [Hibiscus sabdariffa]